MTTPNIVMARIDERLIHGQGQLWIKSLGVNTVIVADDEAAADTMAQTLMKTVLPSGLAVRFFTVAHTCEIIHKANPAQTIFLLCKTPADALALVQGGVPVEEFNVGNIHNAEGKEKVTRSIFLGQQDKEALKTLVEQYHVKLNTQTTPSGTDGAMEVDLTKYL